jgi:phosphatidylserine/phosphatidylglycerophosphate/cardiolipin synthase-like enzyme
MSVDGTWDGKATRAVWTGSENWSDVSLLNDELVVMIPRPRVHDAYVAHFDTIWSRQSKELAGSRHRRPGSPPAPTGDRVRAGSSLHALGGLGYGTSDGTHDIGRRPR